MSRSSRNTSAFSRPGDNSFFKTAAVAGPPQPGPQRGQLGQRRGHPAPAVEQPVDLLHQLAQLAELGQPAADPPQGRPLGGAQMRLDEQVAVLEEVARPSVLDPLLAPGRRRAAGVARGRPRGNFGAVAASRLRSLATAERTALVTSRRMWKVQSWCGT